MDAWEEIVEAARWAPHRREAAVAAWEKEAQLPVPTWMGKPVTGLLGKLVGQIKKPRALPLAKRLVTGAAGVARRAAGGPTARLLGRGMAGYGRMLRRKPIETGLLTAFGLGSLGTAAGGVGRALGPYGAYRA